MANMWKKLDVLRRYAPLLAGAFIVLSFLQGAGISIFDRGLFVLGELRVTVGFVIALLLAAGVAADAMK